MVVFLFYNIYKVFLSKESVTFHAQSQLKNNILKIKQEAHKRNPYLSTIPTTQTSQICMYLIFILKF